MSAAKWPDEIWMAELDDHHNGTGMVVLSEFATVPRWEGDDERDCEFQRYVDGDIHDSQERYFKSLRETDQATIKDLEAGIAERDHLFNNLMITIAAIVVTAGGRVEVSKSVLEDIGGFELEKSQGIDGSIVYSTRRNQAEVKP